MRKGFCVFMTYVLIMSGCEVIPDTNDTIQEEHQEQIGQGGNGDEIPGDEIFSTIKVTLSDWNVTKAYSREDLTTPEMSPGEKVAVIDEEGKIVCFTVVRSNKNSAYLENPDVKLTVGAKYRIQYPYPEVYNTEPFWMALGFGAYEDTPTLDWMVSKWKKLKKDEEFHFNLKRINSVLIFDVVAPFDCVVEEIRLASQKAIFCIKGAFDCSEDDLKPDATAWSSQYPFPQSGMTWVKGEKYTLILTVWPYDYSQDNYSLDIYTVDDRGASAPVVIPELKEGKIMEYEIRDFEILPPPVYKKGGVDEERKGDQVISSYEYPGEGY